MFGRTTWVTAKTREVTYVYVYSAVYNGGHIFKAIVAPIILMLFRPISRWQLIYFKSVFIADRRQ